jgi:hypothetical protein
MTRKHGGELWAITAYFNPAGFRRRLANYRVFRRHLQSPLLTVELSFDGQFELCDDDADSLVRITGGDVMWQKERLLNLALGRLPAGCRYVTWVDCDVIFEDDDWPERTARCLADFVIVQPFRYAYRMPSGWLPGDDPSAGEEWRSIPFLIQSGKTVEECLDVRARTIRVCHGYAWSARRDFLDAHPLYDASIIGGGDSSFIRSAYGRMTRNADLLRMRGPQRRHFKAWGNAFHDSVKSSVGSIGGRLFHLWHGKFENRRYSQRFSDFEKFRFDPFADIAVDGSGVWRWNSDKPAMHDHVRNYFAGRKEDE